MNIAFVEVISIIIIVYLVCLGFKATKLDNKYLPVIAGFVGGILGIVAWISGVPDFPANDFLNALAIGIMNGLAATGFHQVGKQLGFKEG